MNIGDTLELSVHEKHLDTGVHEYLVWFDATCEVIPAGVQIHVDCDLPAYAKEPYRAGPSSNPILPDIWRDLAIAQDHDGTSNSMLDHAVKNIRRGVEYALLHRRHGLRVRIHEFRLHPVDFQPSRFLLHTYYYTRKQLEVMEG
jgi:hypothetical protein